MGIIWVQTDATIKNMYFKCLSLVSHFFFFIRFYWIKMSRRSVQLEIEPIKQESDVPRPRQRSRGSQDRPATTIDLSSDTEEEGKFN